MLTSTRRGIVYPNPNRSDSADVPRDIGANVAALEVDVVYGQGTLAARPTSTPGTPGMQGRVYAATDQTPNQLYYDYGTGWFQVGALAAGAVGTTQLADGSVTTIKIADANVTLAKLAANSVDSSKIVDGTIVAGDLASALKPSAGAGGATEALRAIGTGAGNVIAGNDVRVLGSRGNGTALPSSPASGDRFDWDVYNALVGAGYFAQIDSALGGAAHFWPLIYMAGNTYPWKARAHGGPRLRFIENTNVWRTAGGWGDPSNGGGIVYGPLCYIPRNGNYRVRCGCTVRMQGGGGLASMLAGMGVQNITSLAHLIPASFSTPYSAEAYDSAVGANYTWQIHHESDPFYANAGEQIRAEFIQNSGFTSGTFFSYKWLELIPLEFA